MPDLVFHMVKNTPKQVLSKDGSSAWLLNALKGALRTRGVSMRHLSDSLKIPYRSIQNYFSGESRIPADILLRICGEIGLEADYLAKGSFELSHADLQDALHKVLGDVLPSLDIRTDGKAALRDKPTQDRAELLSVVHVLTVRLNQAYANYRQASFSGQISRPITSTDFLKRRSRKVGQ